MSTKTLFNGWMMALLVVGCAIHTQAQLVTTPPASSGGTTATNLLLNGSSIPLASGSTQTNTVNGTAATISVLSHSSNGVPVLNVSGSGYPFTNLSILLVGQPVGSLTTNTTAWMLQNGATSPAPDPMNMGSSYQDQDIVYIRFGDENSPPVSFSVSVNESGNITGCSYIGSGSFDSEHLGSFAAQGGNGSGLSIVLNDDAWIVPTTNYVGTYYTNYNLGVIYNGTLSTQSFGVWTLPENLNSGWTITISNKTFIVTPLP